jgi:hypothetical protein
LFGGLLPNQNNTAVPGAQYANFQITDSSSGINVDTNIFASIGPVYPSETSFNSFCTTLEKHFSGSRLIAAIMKMTPIASNFVRDGLIYACSAPKGGTRELGPENTGPNADYVNMPKIFSCPGMKTMPCSNGDTICSVWYPKDDDSFEFVPSRQTFSAGDWNRKYRSGALIMLATGMSTPQSFLVEYELFYQSQPSNATFNITGSSLSLGNPMKQSDAMNLFLTNSNVHIIKPDKTLYQNFESRDIMTEPGKSILFSSYCEVKSVKQPKSIVESEDFVLIDGELYKKGESKKETPGPIIKAEPLTVKTKTTYGRAIASAVTSPGGSSSKTALGRKIKEIAKLTDPVVDVLESIFDLF